MLPNTAGVSLPPLRPNECSTFPPSRLLPPTPVTQNSASYVRANSDGRQYKDRLYKQYYEDQAILRRSTIEVHPQFFGGSYCMSPRGILRSQRGRAYEYDRCLGRAGRAPTADNCGSSPRTVCLLQLAPGKDAVVVVTQNFFLFCFLFFLFPPKYDTSVVGRLFLHFRREWYVYFTLQKGLEI